MFSFFKKLLLFIICVWMPCVRTYWKCDDSEGFSFKEHTVIHETTKDGPYNCMWMEGDGVSSGDHYWKIHFKTLDPGGGVCFTSKECFQTINRTKALCYFGSLSNNSNTIVYSFGPQPAAGDTVGILASFKNNSSKVYLDINGKSLGLPFDVPASLFSPMFVMAHFQKSGSARCKRVKEIPKIRKRRLSRCKGMLGDWKLEKATYNKTDLLDDCAFLFGLTTTHLRKTINGNETVYTWTLRQSGSPPITTNLTNRHNQWKKSYFDVGFECAPDLHWYLKNDIEDMMNTLTDIKIDVDNGDLIIESQNISTAWTCIDKPPKHLKLNVISTDESCEIGYPTLIFNP